MTNDFIKIYSRDLDRLKQEIQSFSHGENLWKTTGSIKNSAGNLCLHLTGNLNTYIGKNLGNSEYVRDRDAEFNVKNVAKDKLIHQVDNTKDVVIMALKKLGQKQLEDIYIEDVLGYKMTNGFFLIHLATHLSYHLGQINYIRRVFE